MIAESSAARSSPENPSDGVEFPVSRAGFIRERGFWSPGKAGLEVISPAEVPAPRSFHGGFAMSAQPHRSRSTVKTAAVLFLPAVCVLAVWYATYEQPAEPRQPNELAPSQLGQGFAPHVDLPKPVAESRPVGSPAPDSIEQKAVLNALEARRLTTQPGMPVERPNRR
jgi:hypothetical protein